MKVGGGGRAGGVWGYGSMDKLKAAYPGLKEYWDDVAKAPYLYNESTGAFFTFDNQRSIREKAKYVKENGLGGMITWMASQDATTTSTKRDELTKTIKDALFGSAPLTDYTIKTAPQDLTTTIKTYKEEWNGGAGYEISIKNNERKNESGETLTLIETAYETVKSPKLYITMNNGAKLSQGGYGAGTITNKDGYTVVDLSTVYDNQTIGQGATCTFMLKSSAKDPKLSDIKSIVLVQRILTGGAEISSQVLYGDGSIGGGEGEVTTTTPEETTTTPEVTTTPETTTTPEVTTTPETTTTPEATTTPETTTTPEVTTTPETTTPETTTTPAVTTAPPVDGVPAYDATKIYNGGDKVSYNGKIYQAKWWTQGVAPDGSEWGVWKLIGNDSGSGEITTPPVTTAPGDVPAYIPGNTYVKGDKVMYNGKVYTCKWWTNAAPGPNNDAWALA